PPARLEPNAAELKTDLYAFAADSFRGRETGTPDADRAAAWIARRLQALGLEPAGDSGYFHRVPMQSARTVPKEISVTTPSGKTMLAFGRDIAFLTALGPGAPLPKLSADAEVVFVSYGLVDPSTSRDDYAGLDVAGKVVVIAGLAPPGLDSARKAQMENPQVLFSRLGTAIGKQPAAIILLLPDSVFRLAAGQFAGTQVQLGAANGTDEKPRVLPMVGVARLTTGSPLLPAGWPASDKGTPLAGTRFTAAVTAESRSFNGYNVVGIVRGSDPALRNTFVAYGAHYDHIGIQPSVNGDSIANGADDDGSGSVTLLAIARAFTQGPKPKRSALFVWHVGEEKGLFGSQAFVEHPTVPIDSIVAQLNADMIGRNGDDSLYIVGPGAAPNGQSAVLGAVIDSVNAASPRPFIFDREWDTTTHPERIYYRSDHYNYARKGIPIVFFTTGLHKEYHQVTDEAALINYEKMARIGTLMYRSGLALGDRLTRPKPTGVQ
ncbi:MAG: M28 family peptidase, partial [Gemmatimonadaceae bacterium]